MAAEIAAIGALLIAVAALVVVMFFDTGVRMPWATEAGTQQGESATATSPAAPPSTTSAAPTSASRQPDPPPETGARKSILDRLLDDSERNQFWTSFLGLCLVAVGSYLAGALASAIVGFVVKVVFRPVFPEFAGVVVAVPLVVTAYLWLFWPFLSGFWITVYVVCAVALAVWWRNVLEDHL